MDYPLETTGCDQRLRMRQPDATVQPPFEAGVSVASANSSPGASDRQTVSIKYPRDRVGGAHRGRWDCTWAARERRGCTYDYDSIWQAALKDADVTLPPGMGLAPGGGNGLQECSFAQFGVDPPPASS